MATVTFPVDLGGNGFTYNDGTIPPYNLAGGGHRDNFVPMVSQTVIMAQAAADAAAEATDALDNFDDRYLGPKASDPALDNDGQALVIGALYFRTTAPQQMRVYTSTGWQGLGTYTTGNLFVEGTLRANNTVQTFEPKGTVNGPASVLLDADQFDGFTISYTGAVTFSFATTSPFLVEFTLVLNTITSTSEVWPANVIWAGGTAPNIGNGSTTIIKFITVDTGTTWIGTVQVLNAS